MSQRVKARRLRPKATGGTVPITLGYDWVREYGRHTVARVRIMRGDDKVYGRNVQVDEPKDCAGFEQEVKDRFNGHAPPDIAARLMKLEPTSAAPEPGGDDHDDHPFEGRPRPGWDCGHGDHGVLTRDGIAALRVLNDPPSLFLYQKMVSIVVPDPDDGSAVVEPLDVAGMTDEICERTRPYKESEKEGRTIKTPSERLVKGILHRLRTRVLVPGLVGVTNNPVFTGRDKLLDTPGFDRDSGLYYSPTPGLVLPRAVPERPTDADVGEAKDLIEVHLLGDFPFVSPSDKANAIALPAEQLYRDGIPGQLPMHGCESNEGGTGKDLLAGVLLRIIGGPYVIRCPFPSNEDERRKGLTSMIAEGRPYIYFNNVERLVADPTLDGALTTGVYSDRVLGKNLMMRARVRNSWVMSSNNPTFDSQMARRVVRSRLDAQCSEPHLRKGPRPGQAWRYPDLEAWVDDNRGRLLWAYLVLIQHWIAKGKPEAPSRLGNYGGWQRTVGGILALAGIPGLGENALETFRKHDATGAILRRFMALWHETFGEEWVTAGALFEQVATKVEGFEFGRASTDEGRINVVARYLRQHEGHWEDERSIVCSESSTHQRIYTLQGRQLDGNSQDNQGLPGAQMRTEQGLQSQSVAQMRTEHGVPESDKGFQENQDNPDKNSPVGASQKSGSARSGPAPVTGSGSLGSQHGGPTAQVQPCGGGCGRQTPHGWTCGACAARLTQIELRQGADGSATGRAEGKIPNVWPDYFCPDCPDCPETPCSVGGSRSETLVQLAGECPENVRAVVDCPETPCSDGGAADELPVRVITTDVDLAAVLPLMQAALVLGVDTETSADPQLVEQELLAWQTRQMASRRRPLSDARIAEERDAIREAIATDPRRGRLRWVQIAVPGVAVYLIDALRVDVRRLAPLLVAPERPLLVLHYAAFDLQWFHYLGIDVPDGTRLFDTRGAAALLEASGDAGLPDTSLKAVASRYLGVELDKTEQGGDWSVDDLTAAKRAYAARDASIEPELYHVLGPQLQAAGLQKAWEIEMRCLPATVWCITTGVPVKKDAWLDQAARAELTREEAEAALDRHLQERGLTTERWHQEARRLLKGPLPERVNWQSGKQVQAVFAALGHRVDGVNAEALAALWDEPLAAFYTAYNQAGMKVKTYGINYLRHLNPTTGRLHPTFDQFGSTAGRYSCSRPNLQNVPHERAYRSLIAPETDDDCLLVTDYNQAELRVLAQVTRDPNLIKAFNEGRDLHRWIMSEVLGKSEAEVTDLERKVGKMGNFGMCYGMQPEGFVKKCLTEGIPMSLEKARQIHAMYFKLFAGVKEWQDRIRRSRDYTTRTPAGRRRLRVFGDEERFNSPIQGGAADALKIAMALMWERRAQCPEFALIGTIHDEILGRCPVSCWQAAAAWLERCMVDGMRAIVKVVPVVAEVTPFKDWKQTPLIAQKEGEA